MSSNGKEPDAAAEHQAGPLISFVMMRNTQFPTKAELVAAIKKRIPAFEYTPPETGNEERLAVMGTVEGKICALMLIDMPNPMSSEESFIESAWWWPNIKPDVEERKSHAVVTVMAAGEPTIKDHALLAQLTGAVVEANDTIGVLWNGADAAWRSDMFLGTLDQYGLEPPLPLFVSIKLGRDTDFPAPNGEPAWLGMSCGMMAFGLMELEVRGFAGDTPEPMIDHMQDVAGYLMSSGPIIKDEIGRAHV